MPVMSVTALKAELRKLGIDAKTPGLKGDARRDELQRRLHDATASAKKEEDAPKMSARSREIKSSRITNATISALKAALEALGVDTRTPGIKGEERKCVLEERLAAVHDAEDEEEEEEEKDNDIASTAEKLDQDLQHDTEAVEEPVAFARRKAQRDGEIGQRPSVGYHRRGSYTHRDSPSKPMLSPPTSYVSTSGTGSGRNNNNNSKMASNSKSKLSRPSSAPLSNDSNRESVKSVRAPWAVRTRVGRGRGRSRGACRGVSSRRTGKNVRGGSFRRKPLTERDSLYESKSRAVSTNRNGSVNSGTRDGPPVSARLTARLTSLENRLADAEQAVANHRAEEAMQRSLCQRNKEAAARLRSIREARVAKRSDPACNSDLADLVQRLNDVRNELKELHMAQQKASSSTSFQQFHSKCLNKKNPSKSLLVPTAVAFRELEAMERALDDSVDRVCSRIVQQEEAHAVHGVQMEAAVELEAEKAYVAAERLKRGLASLVDAQRLAKARHEAELERRSRKPPHVGTEAVKDPLKLAENAQFLWEVRDDPETADRVFAQALSRAPDSAEILHLYATFLHKCKQATPKGPQHQRAARLWQRAVLLAPRNPDILSAYASLLHRVMCRPEDATPLVERALSAAPRHCGALLAQALLLQSAGGKGGKRNSKTDFERAQRCFKAAREADPKKLQVVTHYANFLKKCRGDYNEAEKLFEEGLRINPCDADHLGAYAQFMFKVRGNTERAGKLFARAVEADPTHWHNQSRRANMLKKTGNYDEAEKSYKAACGASPNPTTLGNYANFLQLIRKDWEAAQKHYLAALKMEPQHAAVRRNYAAFLKDFPEARVQRNMSRVIDTPVAKALDRACMERRGGELSDAIASPLARKGAKMKPKHSPYRPRKLQPQLDCLTEATPRTEGQTAATSPTVVGSPGLTAREADEFY